MVFSFLSRRLSGISPSLVLSVELDIMDSLSCLLATEVPLWRLFWLHLSLLRYLGLDFDLDVDPDPDLLWSFTCGRTLVLDDFCCLSFESLCLLSSELVVENRLRSPTDVGDTREFREVAFPSRCES